MLNNFALTHPIVFIDLETTGVNPSKDHIVELTALKILPDGSEDTRSVRLNPGVPIPEGATRVHGITDSDVADKPIFKQYATSLLEFLDGCDLAGYNIIRFDLPLLSAEFSRIGLDLDLRGRSVVDPMVIFHRMEPRDLAAAYRVFCGKELEDAHTSLGDVKASVQILNSQAGKYAEIAGSIENLHEFCHPVDPNWIDSEGRLVSLSGGVALGFGKHQGSLLQEIVASDPDYLDWMLSSNFSNEVKERIREAMKPNNQEP